ncbi:hypothetical protein SAMN02982929_05316 [Saccharopolyspora kobensis]|uniref:Uncharacterized protein n=1 Tax=Saccharopolyspora kobensis TaxID=146035 RepID=A0A1H6DZN9_9PSEU|nr:hypothetical protein [Saccharopolyspora kobensis]SEG90802.1 hypothetical protein SAMN02982929_05316 [Saccharopolyspora kobensis]SFD93950.1 hypothetical protein SAMN05216506_107292 [Saccharopolyspora kobensis]
MTTATPEAGRIARLWAVFTTWAAALLPSRRREAAQARPAPGSASRTALVEAVQIGAEVTGLAAFVVAGFLASAIAGFVVLGLVLLVVGNVRWR